ncbi:MAG: toxin ParE1/3/4 [Sphingomonadales bacterium]|jgi:toxin ParE1/3/4|nr:toxin ParE1/3/4 [Sphingomonadales bacterium]
MRLELSRKAQADLDDIRDYSAAEFGVERAVAYLDALVSAFRRIVDFPEIGAVHPAVRPLTRSLGSRQHRIFYEIGGDRILIVRILHKAMDAERHL